jgi:hypothetical protein
VWIDERGDVNVELGHDPFAIMDDTLARRLTRMSVEEIDHLKRSLSQLIPTLTSATSDHYRSHPTGGEAAFKELPLDPRPVLFDSEKVTRIDELLVAQIVVQSWRWRIDVLHTALAALDDL